MNKLVLTLTFTMISHVFAMAQTTKISGLEADNNLRLLGKDGTSSAIRLFDNRYEGIKGNPYFRNEWCKAKITKGSVVFEDVIVKYNIYDNKLVFKKSDGNVYEIHPAIVDNLVLEDSLINQKYEMKRIEALSAIDLQLAQRLAISVFEGEKMRFYLLPQKKYRKASFQESYSVNRTQDEFVLEETYYLVGPDNAISKVKLSKKDLLKALADKKAEVEKYMARERRTGLTVYDWERVLAYYESL